MSFRASPSVEERFVLDCLRVEGPDAAPPARLDTVRTIALADRHRVAGLIGQPFRSRDASRGGDDDALAAVLAARRESNAGAFLDQMCALVSAERVLERIGVPHAVLKGPELVRLYRDESERHAGDLDILLREPADAPAAIDALLADGWRTDLAWNEWSARRREKHLRAYKDLTLRRSHGHAPLELHWRAFQARDLRRDGDPFERLVTRRAGGRNFPGFGDLDEAAYLLMHGTRHAWARLKWLADIVRVDAALGSAGADAARSIAFPPEHADARSLVDRLLDEVRGADASRGHVGRHDVSNRRRARQRDFVGTLLDRPMASGFVSNPSVDAFEARLARLALGMSLAHPRERIGIAVGAVASAAQATSRRIARGKRR